MISIEMISDDMDESLSLTLKQRKEIKEDIMQDIEKLEKLSKDERERLIEGRHKENLNVRKRRKGSK